MTSSTNLLKSAQEIRPYHDWLPPDFGGVGSGALRTAGVTAGIHNLPSFDPPAAGQPFGGNQPSGDLATFVALQAQELLASAKGDADAIRAKAYEEGLLAANEEAARIILQAQGILHEVQAWRDEILTQGEASIMALVLQIGKKVFGEGIDLDPENLQKNVEQALALAKPLGDLHIHLHPDDVEKIQPAWTSIQNQNNLQTLQLVPDGAIRKGGCLIEGQSGCVDARVETQLDVIGHSIDQVSPVHEEMA